MFPINEKDYLEIVNEYFHKVFNEYGFMISETKQDLIIAKNKHIELIFRLGYVYKGCYLS